jgi:hypothetical protein
MSFGGYKESGKGRELGPYGLRLYLESKSVCVNMDAAKNILNSTQDSPMATASE